MTRPPTRPRRHAVVGGVVALLATAGLLTACGAGSSAGVLPGGDERAGPAVVTSEELTGTLTVLAAASLTEAFGDLGRRFEELHPGLEVTFSFAGSPTLAQQVLAGAPADVLATADRPTMGTVTDVGAHAAEPSLLAGNTLQIAVPPDNPANITALTDLVDPGVVLAVCAAEVPCGAASQALVETTGLAATPATFERDVRAVLTKVRLGEVDAGLVYRTDVAAAGDDVLGIVVPEAEDPALLNDYLIVPLAEAPHPEAADAFVAFVLADVGREVLAAAGFLVP